jgi:hypothetical protein
MKDPFGKNLDVGDIVLYTRYNYRGPDFVIAKILEISKSIDRTETRGILKAEIIKSSSKDYLTGGIFSSYNSNVLLLKSIKGAV